MIPGDAVRQWVAQQSAATLDGDVYDWLSKVYMAADNKLLTVGGTVKCYIITSEFKAPSSALVQNVQNLLDPDQTAGEGDGLAPIGHVVNVQGVREEPMDLSMSVTYREGDSFASLKQSMEKMMDEYFMELAETWSASDHLIVRISQVEARLLLLEGIVDISDVRINGASDNVTLAEDAIPVRGDVIG